MSIASLVDDWLTTHRDEVIGWRRHLHAHPELSNQERQTTEFLATVLRAHGLEPVLFPTTGLMVDIGPDTDQRIAFRADIDALPITEVTGLECSSLNPGVAHACGHDVHTTIVLALACALADADLPHGVRMLFQPAEEIVDGGAEDVIAWGGLEGVSSIFAVHVEPKLRVGRIGVRTGAITSATDIIELEVHGPGGHSSRPHLSADVIYALGALATQLPALLSRRVDPRSGTVLVFGQVDAGYAPNAIPETGRITGTLRTADHTTWRTFEPLLRELIGQVLAPTGCSYELTYHRGVPPVLNDDVATSLLAAAGRSGDPQAVVEAPQSSGGEDFSWYLERVPGAMARLGCWSGEGDRQDLHQGDLVVDENAIFVGARLFAAVIDEYCAVPEQRA
ncbi:amidohydrolase [Corynebacterium yudongzhengii]|uniref:Amidohydrolase n=1 Tax=Corynebacterium yudongzhengii TaxID=2080740 RepID=A0A2U1T7C7_9CORY|nr:amidohydrolase [Corynebacterium yudongzhengii]AWB81355.1 amidohydrolase [Corynebacterium yudongzhengii]PWC01798.1 amidohydrolase [Corynebacterium yudongzhengii]